MNESPTDHRPLFKRALSRLDELQAKLDRLERPLNEPIAILGVACRFPGGANNPETFWRLLLDGFDATSEVPPDRWDVDALYDPAPATPRKMYTRRGAFLDNVADFDPHFFGIAPREALSMDPQQRLLLEVSWEAIEDAGLAPSRLAGSPTGVFVGISNWDYNQLHSMAGEVAGTYTATGSAHSIAAGRLSYLLDLRGPNVALDTACSSSIVALHLACQSLRMRESRLALAAGVNTILSPDSTIATCQARMMAADGRCKTFDAAADGYVRGEGCGVVVLKPLSDALADGDRILALIRGTAVNQDGRSNGITAPNGPAQEAVIREALSRAGISGSQVDYVEAHGTGTSLGDPIEVRALGAVLGAGRPKERPFLIGSVKTNIGHMESAAGIAGLIKVVLALRHEEIPPHLNLKTPNPLIPWDELPIRVVAERTAWPRGQERRIAGVSSFGFSGTNAHLIVEEAPPAEARVAEVERPIHLLAISAKSTEALRQLADRYRCRLADECFFPDVCHTANAGRSHFSERFAVIASSAEEAREKLEAPTTEEGVGVLRGQVVGRNRMPVAFLFTGQGSQYPGMGRQLLETQPTFRKALLRCDEILRPLLPRPLLSVVFGDGEDARLLDQTAYTQPALFALEWALSELWRSWGIEPALVMGHSVGEYVSACVAGVFSLEDGLRLIAERGRLMQALPLGGEMAAVFADEKCVAAAVAPHARAVSIAAVNGPENVVISGRREAVEAIRQQLGAEGIKSKRLAVSHAFHSPLMEPMLDAFERVVRGTTFSSPRVGVVSNVTGRVVEPEELADPGYWRRHVREAVRFAAGMDALREQGCEVFLELGPHPALLGMGARCLPEGYGRWLPSLRKGRDDWRQMLESLGSLYVHGVDIDWAGFDRDYTRRKVSLPTYPFQRQPYWAEAATRGARSVGTQARDVGPMEHPLLGRRLRSALRHVQYESAVSCDSPHFLKDHAFFGSPVFPGAGYIEMALAAVSATGEGTPRLEDLRIEEPLLLPEGGTRTVQFVLDPEGSFDVFSLGDGGDQAEWRRHAGGRVSLFEHSESSAPGALVEVRKRCDRKFDVEGYYRDLRAHGVEYGPGFQGIEAAWSGADEAIAHVRLPDDLIAEAGSYRFHPVLLDAGFQLLGPALAADFGTVDSDVYMPTAVKRLTVPGHIGTRLWVHLVRVPGKQDSRTLSADIRFFDEAGNLVATIEGLEVRRAKRDALAGSHGRAFTEWFYEVAWEEKPVAVGSPAGGRWLILADAGGLASGLVKGLEARGAGAVLATPGAVYRPLGEDRYELDPDRREDFEALVRGVTSGGGQLRGVVHLWALDAQGSISASMVEAQRKSLTSALHLAQCLAKLEVTQTPPLWLVTRGAQAVRPDDRISPEQTSLWGLARTIALEIPNLRCARLDLEGGEGGEEPLLTELFATDGEDQVACRRGARFVARLARAKANQASLPAPGEGQAFQLQIPTRGVLDNLKLVPIDRRPPGRGEVEVEVEASGLNFRDVLNALGMYPGDPGPLGGECAGRVVAVGEDVEDLRVGDEVLGLAAASFTTYVTTRAEILVRKPSGLSLEESATIPIVFLTAHYGLNRLARMRAGERVLIHAGAGGVGMAAVQLAQKVGAEIFATAGSPEKRELLRSLGIRHVMDSRSLSFADEIIRATGGEGIDVVLNSLADEFIPKSLSLLRDGGRFLEIGKRGIWSREQVRQVKPEVEYHVIYLGDLAETQPGLVREMLGELVEAFESGSLKRLPRTVFSVRDAANAFRYMAQAKHVGKVVLRQDATRGSVRADGSYLVTGGLGGLGLTVARWLVEQGARHLVLLGRREPTAEARQAIAAMEAQGASVRVFQADVSRQEDIANVLAEIERSMPPLRGVVHAAGVLDDGVLLQQDWERFQRVMAPKVEGAWNLHILTRHCPLDFFVLFSSMASLMGSPAQGNYAAANAFLDGLAWQRRSEGLPGLSINWGPWAEVGMVAGLRDQDQRRHAEKGVEPILPGDGARAFGQLLRDGASSQVMVAPIRWGRLLEQLPGRDVPAFLRNQARESSVATTASTCPAEGPPLLRRLEEAPIAQRRDLILGHVRELALKVLGLPASHPIDLRKPLSEMGLDSLMAVELRNAFSASFGTTFPATLLFDYPTIQDLAQHLGERFAGAPAAEAQEASSVAAEGRAKLLAEVRHLSDAEAESLIEKELGNLIPR